MPMKPLPPGVTPFKQTPVFDEATVPLSLRSSHTTKTGMWGRIVVVEGSLVYRILEPEVEAFELVPGTDGVIEPEVRHEVVPGKGTRFYVEFLK